MLINNTKEINNLQECCLSRSISCVLIPMQTRCGGTLQLRSTDQVTSTFKYYWLYWLRLPQSHPKDYIAKIASMQPNLKRTEIRNVWLKSEINLHELLKNVLCCTLGTNDVSNRESNSPKLTKEMCKVMGNTLQCCIKFKCWCIMMTWHEDMKVLRWTDMKIWRWTVKNAKNAH